MLAAILSVVIVLTGIQFPTFANVEYSEYLDGWKVQCAWANLSTEYAWNAKADEIRQPKIVVTYRMENAAKDYPAESLVFTIPGIGNADRGSILKASKLAADEGNSEWSYTWDKLSDTYTFKNAFAVKAGQSVSGGFELLWTLNSRNCVDGYVQEKSPCFAVADAGSITMEPLSYSFTSEQDHYRLHMYRDKLSSTDYENADKAYVWYDIETRFDKDWLARGIYRSSYHVTVEIPEGESYEDVIVKSDGKNMALEQDEDGKWGFYPFKNQRGNIGTQDTTKYVYFQVGFKKATLSADQVTVHGHLDRLYNDRPEWEGSASENEKVDDELVFMVDDYGFTHKGYIYGHEQYGQYEYDLAGAEPKRYIDRLNAMNLYTGKIVQFTLYGTANRSYASPRMFYSRNGTATPSDAERRTEKRIEEIPEGMDDWNDIDWLENKLFPEENTLQGLAYGEIHSSQDATPSEAEAGEDEEPIIPDINIFNFFGKKIDDIFTMQAYAAEATPSETEKNPLLTDDADRALNAAGSSQIEENQKYSLVMGSDKLAIFLNDGSIRNLEDSEYDMAYITVPTSTKHYDYEVYGASSQDVHFNDYVLLGTGNTSTKKTVQFPEGVKAAFIRVNGISGSYSYNAYVGIRLHLDWKTEQEKDGPARPDHENRLINFSYLRSLCLNPSGEEVNDCTVNVTEYNGSYGEELADRDMAVYDEQLMRDYSNVWLRSPVTNLSSKTEIEAFEGTGKKGFTSSITSSGTIKADNPGLLKQFSLYTVIPEGLQADFDNTEIQTSGTGTDSNGASVSDFAGHVTFRTEDVNGKVMLVADYDYTDSPLQAEETTAVSVSFPVTLSYADYTAYGNQYTVNSYTMVHDDGLDKVSGPAIIADEYDIDGDGITTEKMAYSNDTEVVLDVATEWREYVSKFVRSPYSTGYVADTVTRLYQESDTAEDKEKSNYSYRLDFGLGSSNAKNIVFYDHIEQGAEVADNIQEDSYRDIPSDWQGKFKSVDTAYVEKLGIVPTIYYSTQANQEFDLSADGWATELPEAPSSVKSVAVSLDTSNLEDGLLKTRQMAYVIINMEAPSERNLVGKTAVNQYEITYDGYGLTNDFEKSYRLSSAETYVKLLDSVGRIILQKVDADNLLRTDPDGTEHYAALTEGKFQVYDSNGKAMFDEPQSLNSMGRIVLRNIPFGTYYWEELEAPAGYQKAEGRQAFEIDGVTEIKNMENRRIRGTVTLTKEDADYASNGQLAGAEFELFQAGGNQVFSDEDYAVSETGSNSTFVTGADGTLAVTNLPWGSYYFKESKAPEGYELNDAIVSFTIDKTHLSAACTAFNDQMPASVLLEKKDAENGKKLKDAYYDLYIQMDNGDWKKIRENLKTNAAGELIVEDLKFGEYKFMEVQPPAGYELSSDEISFTLDSSTAGMTVSVAQEDKRKTGSVKLVKVSEDQMPLADAVYALYKEGVDNPVAENLVTGADGTTPAITELSWGNYYFIETAAPKGYALNAEKVPFTVNASTAGVTQEVTAEDFKIKGSVRLTKKDEATKAILLPGAEFSLYKNDGSLVKSGLTTGADGTVLVNGLDWGSYYFEETKAPAGYGISASKIRFSVNSENCSMVQELQCFDPASQVQIKINKEINERYEHFGSPTFIFEISGNDVNGISHQWIKSVTLKGSDGGSVILSGIPAGTYAIKEIESSRYKQSDVIAVRNVTVSGGAAVANLTAEKDAEVTFKNSITQYEKLNHTTAAMNVVSAKTKLIGFGVDYKGPELIQSDTESEYTFTADDLEATAFFDDGTSKVVPFQKLELDPATVTGDNNSSGSGYTVTVKYTDGGITLNDSFSVEINLKEPERIYTVTYDSNGGYFNGDTTVTTNQVAYKFTPMVRKTAKTSNVSEDGASFSGGYGNGKADNTVITIPGAHSLHVKITYQTEGIPYDWVCLYEGTAITPSASNHSSSLSGKLGGTEKKTEEFDITGDTVQIFFRSDSSNDSYFGYYAEITGVSTEEDVGMNEAVTGVYSDPEHIRLLFDGWYIDSACSTEFDIGQRLTENITVYAKWKEPQAVFDTGSTVNLKMKRLAGGDATDYNYLDTEIKSFKPSLVSPDIASMTEENIVSSSDSETPIYMWSEDGTIYWWSKCTAPMLNRYSTLMFTKLQALTSLDLSGFDTSNVTRMGSMFSGCSALTSLDLSGFDTSNVTEMNAMLNRCSALVNLDISNFDTSKVTDMGLMFYGCSALASLDLSGFNTSYVTNMNGMFQNCSALTRLDISSFDTSSTRNMSSLFYNCSALNNLDVSGFDTSNVTNMSSMFSNCKSLLSLDVSRFNTSIVKSMDYTFYNCVALTSLDLSGFDTSNVTKMRNMFSTCSALASLDVSGFDTSNVTDMASMFYGCKSLISLDISSFNTASVTNMGYMFYSCNSLVNLDTSSLNTSSVTNMDCMFSGCNVLSSLDVSSFDTSNVTSMNSMFSSCYKLPSLDVSGFDTSKVTKMNNMFFACNSLIGLDVSGFDTSNVTNMNSMFSSCYDLASLDVSGFDTSNVTNMASMFFNCHELPSLDVSGFDTSKVTTMYNMFAGCMIFSSLNVKSFDTANVNNINGMFSGCKSLISLDLKNFNTSNVTDMSSMFYNCASLTNLDVSGFNTSSVINMSYMFRGCEKMSGLDLSSFDTSNVSNMNYMFGGCRNLANLNLSNFNISNVSSMTSMFNAAAIDSGDCVIVCTEATENILKTDSGMALNFFTFIRP